MRIYHGAWARRFHGRIRELSSEATPFSLRRVAHCTWVRFSLVPSAFACREGTGGRLGTRLLGSLHSHGTALPPAARGFGVDTHTGQAWRHATPVELRAHYVVSFLREHQNCMSPTCSLASLTSRVPRPLRESDFSRSKVEICSRERNWGRSQAGRRVC